MNPTFTYLAVSVAVAAVVASAAYLIRTLVRLGPIIERIDDTTRFLETSRPKLDRIMDSLEVELVELHGISAKMNRIAGHAESMTTGLKFAVQPIITEVSDLGQLLRHARAIAVAVKTGLLAWRDHGRSHGGEPPTGIEYDEESRG
ncbi:MAG: hypothetical protein C0395_06115 [Gemmatimonas sp.]|nr:hypothetical protein [Gemmatimonas sp.]